MSGPIIRKYGFPNFEQIFGKRDLEHGVEQAKAKPSVVDAADQNPPSAEPTPIPIAADATSKPDH